MVYSYEDLCAWRKEAQMELKKQKAKVNKTKGFSDRVDGIKKGFYFFSKFCESGALQQILEKFGK